MSIPRVDASDPDITTGPQGELSPVLVTYDTGGDAPTPIRWDWEAEGHCVVVGPEPHLVVDRIVMADVGADVEVFAVDPTASGVVRALDDIHRRIAVALAAALVVWDETPTSQGLTAGGVP
jgi:hypothetical protein